MKNKVLHLLLLSLFAISLNNCTEDAFTQVVEIDIPEHQSKIACTLSLTEGDTLISTFVSKSLEINVDEIFPNLENATVNLYKNGSFFSALELNNENKNYEAIVEPILGDGGEYQIEIEVPELGTATATQTMPDKVNIENYNLEIDGGVDEYGDKVSIISFKIQDRPGEENYYGFDIYILRKYENDDNVYKNHYYTYSIDPLLEETWDGGIILNDDGFEGGEYQVRLNLDNYALDTFGLESLVIQTAIKSLSRDSYIYTKSLYQYFNALNNPFAEPVILHNNFENGYGIFSCDAVQYEDYIVK